MKGVFRPGQIRKELNDNNNPKHYGNKLSSLENETRRLADGNDFWFMPSIHELRVQETDNKQFVVIYIYIYVVLYTVVILWKLAELCDAHKR